MITIGHNDFVYGFKRYREKKVFDQIGEENIYCPSPFFYRVKNSKRFIF